MENQHPTKLLTAFQLAQLNLIKHCPLFTQEQAESIIGNLIACFGFWQSAKFVNKSTMQDLAKGVFKTNKLLIVTEGTNDHALFVIVNTLNPQPKTITIVNSPTKRKKYGIDNADNQLLCVKW